jgi:LysM repeat protein
MAEEILTAPNDGISLEKSAAEGQSTATPLPPKTPQYVRVNPGDSLDTIAERYGTTPEDIMKVNDYAINPDYLLTGHWIWV